MSTTSGPSPTVSSMSSPKSSNRVWKRMMAFVVVVSFIAGTLFITVLPLPWHNSWGSSPHLSENVHLAGQLTPSAVGKFHRGFAPGEGVYRTTAVPASDYYENSADFRAFVMAKMNDNMSTVKEYLASVRGYLLNFCSPMIREKPGQYSWSETAEEREGQRTPNAGGSAPSGTKRIVWFNGPVYWASRKTSQEAFGHCPVKDCEVSFSHKEDHAQADVVVFNGVPGKTVIPRDHPGQIYVFFTMESPIHTNVGYSNTPWNSAFNWTWNFRTDADIFTPINYLKRSLPSLDHIVNVTRRKAKLVAWISSHCGTQSRRDEYVNRLQQTIPVDHYGRCGNLKCDDKTPNCSAMLNDYFYYLSFENSMCPDYVTEKFYKTFYQDIHVLAVVRGGATYSRYFPEGTFIDADSFASPKELGQYLLDLSKDEPRYVDMLWKKAHFVFHEHGSVDAYCQLCYKAHHAERFAKTYPDMYGWYHRDQCKPPRKFR